MIRQTWSMIRQCWSMIDQSSWGLTMVSDHRHFRFWRWIVHSMCLSFSDGFMGMEWDPFGSSRQLQCIVSCGLLEQDGRYFCSGYGQGLTAVWGGAKGDACELSSRHFVCSVNSRLRAMFLQEKASEDRATTCHRSTFFVSPQESKPQACACSEFELPLSGRVDCDAKSNRLDIRTNLASQITKKY